MEERSAVAQMQQYRRDRRALLNFLLSSSLIRKVVLPPGAVSLDDVDLDQVGVNYVLSCAKTGDILELSEAVRDFHERILYPAECTSGFAEEFFLSTNMESSGSPPARPPPPVSAALGSSFLSSLPTSYSIHSGLFQELSANEIDDLDDDEEVQSMRTSRPCSDGASKLILRFPPFETGISDDELRESAYEILLASAAADGSLILPAKEKKKDRKSRLLKKLARSKTDNVVPPCQHSLGLADLLETMRVQLEISEAVDVRTRKALHQAVLDREGKGIHTLLVPLELLCHVSVTEFSDKKAFLRWQKRQLNILEEGLTNYTAVGLGDLKHKANELKALLRKIEQFESLSPSAREIQRAECLRSLRVVALTLAERPAYGGQTGDVCHWADGYHLNVRLYEKLLFSVFDILDEGKFVEEVEEILELLKSTWRMIGITEPIHYMCYAWVLFQQFVVTGELWILQHAAEQLRKIPLKELLSAQDRLHLKNLRCCVQDEDGWQHFTFLESILLPIQTWSDSQLSDYHLHFTEKPDIMEGIITIMQLGRRIISEEPGLAIQMTAVSDHEQIGLYVSSSVTHAFARILKGVEALADVRSQHPLVLLADECEKLLKKDSALFMPILSKWNYEAKAVSASVVHKLYGCKLNSLLDHADHLTEDVISVISAAESLEQQIIALITSVCEDKDINCSEYLTPYKVEDVSVNLVLRWINSQTRKILEWVERAVQQEKWEPISPQQQHGSSVVEVFRIVEEAIDQFFDLKITMRHGELNTLLRSLDNIFQVYARDTVDRLGSEKELVPPAPVLTRHKKESFGITALVRKDISDTKLSEQNCEISVPSTSNLCVRLNTLHYAINQLRRLEDGIWDRWTDARAHEIAVCKMLKDRKISSNSCFLEQNDGFEGSRKIMDAAMDKICKFIGTKIIFFNLREPFIYNLYKPSVSLCRFETLVDALDTELNQICDVITMSLRDRVVTSLLHASLDGLNRVLLDGGPLRVFFPSDASLLEEDLDILKEFFISGGQGLPRGTVENLISRIRPIIVLHSYESRMLINDLKLSAIEGRTQLGDAQILLRILCHRSDSEANQFLKKQYKIPRSSA